MNDFRVLDTLLNVFLAIAVDNLTNAQELSEDEDQEEKERKKHKQEIKEKYAPKGRLAINSRFCKFSFFSY